jgi:hypothetical protein
MKRLSYLSNCIRQLWALGRIFDADAMVAAGEQLNDTPVPFSTNPGSHKATRWELYMEGEETSDLSRWVGEPGQSLWAHVAGSKANMGEPNARAGIFLYPLRGAGGFVIRMLESRRLMVAYSISLVNDRHLRHARLLESYQGTGRHGQDSGVRALFANMPGTVDECLLCTDPITRRTTRLELEAGDDGAGEGDGRDAGVFNQGRHFVCAHQQGTGEVRVVETRTAQVRTREVASSESYASKVHLTQIGAPQRQGGEVLRTQVAQAGREVGQVGAHFHYLLARTCTPRPYACSHS